MRMVLCTFVLLNYHIPFSVLGTKFLVHCSDFHFALSLFQVFRDQSGVPGYNHVCALADNLVTTKLPFSAGDVIHLNTLAGSLHPVDKELSLKKPARSLLTLKHRGNKTPGVDSTKR